MKYNACLFFFVYNLLLFFVQRVNGQTVIHDTTSIANVRPVKIDTFDLFDYFRNRKIPIALYSSDSLEIKQKLILFSHGYNENKSGSHLAYSYLNIFLAQHGYLVASVQHELPGDEPLSMKGNLQETRMPNWENGIQNLLFTIKELKNRIPNLDDKRVIVIGHSNGGDISMLFAGEYQQKIDKAISLDNRRMPLPKVGPHKIYTLRSNDLPADKGVLPNAKVQEEFAITIVNLPHTKHIEITDDTASAEQKKEIEEYVLKFLNER